MSHVLICKSNPLGCLVRLGTGLLEGGTLRCYPQDTTAVCDDSALCIKLTSRMEAELILPDVDVLQTGDFKALLIGDGIAVGSKYDADRRIVLKL